MNTLVAPLADAALSRESLPPFALGSEAGRQCFHCGLPVAAGTRFCIAFDGQMRSLCCAGCEAVAQTIVDAGLELSAGTR